jgi:hypothetical protein
MIKTEPTVWDQYKRETSDILEVLVDVHQKDSFKDLVIEEITSEIISGRGREIASESNFWHEYLYKKINSFPDKYQSIIWSFTAIFLWNLNIVSNEKFITNSPEIEEKIKDKIETAKVLLTKFYSKDIVADTQENCVDLEEYGLDIYKNVYSVGVNSKTMNWLGYNALFFDNNNKKIRLINDLNLYGFYVDNMFIKPNTHRVLTLDLFEIFDEVISLFDWGSDNWDEEGIELVSGLLQLSTYISRYVDISEDDIKNKVKEVFSNKYLYPVFKEGILFVISYNLSCSYDELIRNCEIGFFPLYDEFAEKLGDKEVEFIL